jgi:hypothetical protein
MPTALSDGGSGFVFASISWSVVSILTNSSEIDIVFACVARVLASIALSDAASALIASRISSKSFTSGGASLTCTIHTTTEANGS